MKAFRVRGTAWSLLTLCAEAPAEVTPRDLAARLKDALAGNEWVSVVSECDLVPPEDVLLSPAMYAVRALLTGSMISEWLEIEVLLYLVGDRNIRRVLPLLAGRPSRCLGLICLTTGSPEEFGQRLRDLLRREGLSPRECRGEWAKRYAELLGIACGVGCNLEKQVASVLRARAALLALEAQR